MKNITIKTPFRNVLSEYGTNQKRKQSISVKKYIYKLEWYIIKKM